MKRFAMFAAGVLFGTTGIKVLGSKDTKKAYGHFFHAFFSYSRSHSTVRRRPGYTSAQSLSRRQSHSWYSPDDTEPASGRTIPVPASVCRYRTG